MAGAQQVVSNATQEGGGVPQPGEGATSGVVQPEVAAGTKIVNLSGASMRGFGRRVAPVGDQGVQPGGIPREKTPPANPAITAKNQTPETPLVETRSAPASALKYQAPTPAPAAEKSRQDRPTGVGDLAKKAEKVDPCCLLGGDNAILTITGKKEDPAKQGISAQQAEQRQEQSPAAKINPISSPQTIREAPQPQINAQPKLEREREKLIVDPQTMQSTARREERPEQRDQQKIQVQEPVTQSQKAETPAAKVDSWASPQTAAPSPQASPVQSMMNDSVAAAHAYASVQTAPASATTFSNFSATTTASPSAPSISWGNSSWSSANAETTRSVWNFATATSPAPTSQSVSRTSSTQSYSASSTASRSSYSQTSSSTVSSGSRSSTDAPLVATTPRVVENMRAPVPERVQRVASTELSLSQGRAAADPHYRAALRSAIAADLKQPVRSPIDSLIARSILPGRNGAVGPKSELKAVKLQVGSPKELSSTATRELKRLQSFALSTWKELKEQLLALISRRKITTELNSSASKISMKELSARMTSAIRALLNATLHKRLAELNESIKRRFASHIMELEALLSIQTGEAGAHIDEGEEGASMYLTPRRRSRVARSRKTKNLKRTKHTRTRESGVALEVSAEKKKAVASTASSAKVLSTNTKTGNTISAETKQPSRTLDVVQSKEDDDLPNSYYQDAEEGDGEDAPTPLGA